MLSQVNFISLVKTMESECDLMVEVGPGKVLAGLVEATTTSPNLVCLPLESKPGRDRDLNTVLGSFFVRGGEINWQVVYGNRLVRPFVRASQRIFIENQCERPFQVTDAEIAAITPVENGLVENGTQTNSLHQFIDSEELVEALTEYFSERGLFLAELIRADLQSLPLLSTITQDR
jgi:acyl transferase domain-containing protein